MVTMSARYTVIDGEVVAQERGGVRHQLVPDALGSTVALYNDSGTKTDTFSYWPYGESATRTGTTLVKLQFVGSTGYYKDNVHISYIRARYLNSNSTKWISQDPLGYNTGSNIYSYVGGNTTTNIDPSGLVKIRIGHTPVVGRCGTHAYIVICNNSGTDCRMIEFGPSKSPHAINPPSFSPGGLYEIWGYVWPWSDPNKNQKRLCDERRNTAYNDRPIYEDDKDLPAYINRINNCINKMKSRRALYEPIIIPKPGMPGGGCGNSNLAARWILEKCLGLNGIHIPKGIIAPYWDEPFPIGWR